MGGQGYGWVERARPGLRNTVATAALSAVLLTGCASAPKTQTATPQASMSEADAIAAAKRSPIAQPEARSRYPEQRPPPLPARPPAAPPPAAGPQPSALAARPAAAPSVPRQGAITTAQPPPGYEGVEASYAPVSPYYVWAPGYWYWDDGRYAWVGGAWIPRRTGYVYVRPRWVYTEYGWSFAPGGWATTGTTVVVYPIYRPRDHAYYRPPPRMPVYGGRGGTQAPRARRPVYSRPGPSQSSRMTVHSGRRIR